MIYRNKSPIQCDDISKLMPHALYYFIYNYIECLRYTIVGYLCVSVILIFACCYETLPKNTQILLCTFYLKNSLLCFDDLSPFDATNYFKFSLFAIHALNAPSSKPLDSWLIWETDRITWPIWNLRLTVFSTKSFDFPFTEFSFRWIIRNWFSDINCLPFVNYTRRRFT